MSGVFRAYPRLVGWRRDMIAAMWLLLHADGVARTARFVARITRQPVLELISKVRSGTLYRPRSAVGTRYEDQRRTTSRTESLLRICSMDSSSLIARYTNSP